MKCIYVFSIDHEIDQVLSLPGGSRPVHVAFQHTLLRIWAICPVPQDGETKWRVRVIPSGTEFDFDPSSYLGTVFGTSGTLAWHVFAEIVS